MQTIMKKISIAALGASVLLLSACGDDDAGTPRATDAPETELQKISYAIGRTNALPLEQLDIEFDPAFYNAGFYDAFDGEQRLTDEEVQQALMTVQRQAMTAQQEKQTKELTENQEKADAFLAENAEKEGVVTLESGLQYKIIEDADGPKPNATDQVTVHYEGRLIDGTVFDSSIERGEPATFFLNQVIAGWTEALQLMSPGAKWQLFIPPQIAYGPQARPPHIKPNSALVFDVELIDIVEPAASDAHDHAHDGEGHDHEGLEHKADSYEHKSK